MLAELLDPVKIFLYFSHHKILYDKTLFLCTFSIETDLREML